MPKEFDKIHSSQNEIINKLHLKDNKLNKLLNEDYNWKKNTLIAETDWITATVSRVGQVTSLNKYLPAHYTLSEDLDFNLDDKFVPFLSVDVLTKKHEKMELVGIMPYNQEFYENDYVEIYGNGSTLIYKGTPHLLNFVYSQEEFDNGNFPEAYSKKAYYAEITYTQSGFEWKVTGTLSALTVRHLVSMSSGGNPNIDQYQIDPDPSTISGTGYARFTTLLDDTATGRWYKTEERWSTNPFPPPAEIQTITPFDNVTTSRALTGVDREIYQFNSGSLYKKISGNWVFQSLGLQTIDSDAKPILTRSFNLLGYWVFWSEISRYSVAVRNVIPTTPDGIYSKKELYNLPIDPYRFWTTINFKRNYPPHPEVNASSFLHSGYKHHELVRLWKTTDSVKNKYRIHVGGLLVFKNIADQETVSNYPTYNDTYTKTGVNPSDSYVLTSENHTLQALSYYRGDFIDFEYKVRISILNPYDFSDRHNYAV